MTDTKKKYELKRFTEDFGSVKLELETLADLDQAIDQLCEGVDEKSAEAVFAEELCPYFGVIWPAARAASEHLARMGSWLNEKTVLEVGCGLALPSLVAAKLGAKVIATDFHPDVPEFFERNRALNGISPGQLQFKRLDWSSPEAAALGTFDFVVGSDVLYESQHPTAVANALASHCHTGSHILLTDPGRVYLQKCIDELIKLGFRQDTFVKTVRDAHSDRAGDKPTKEVFVILFQKN
jgi:predicted nicotinamide N-methyase